MSRLYHKSHGCGWVNPRGQSGLTREYKHGPIEPMQGERAGRPWLVTALWFTGLGLGVVIWGMG